MNKGLVVLQRWKFLLVLFVSMSVSAGVVMSMGFVVMLEKLGEASLPEVVAEFIWIGILVVLLQVVILTCTGFLYGGKSTAFCICRQRQADGRCLIARAEKCMSIRMRNTVRSHRRVTRCLRILNAD